MRLPFLTAVALAGLAYLVAEALVRRVPALRAWRVPAPLLGGFGAALVLFGLRLAGAPFEVPASGVEVDFLVALLTTNMGLHVSTKVLRQGWPVFLLFPLLAAVLFFVQLLVALPYALTTDAPLATAVLAGPLAFVGAPFNLNPPQQVPPIRALLEPAVGDPDAVAKGLMMLGIAAAVVLPGLLERALARRHGEPDTPPSLRDEDARASVAEGAHRLAALLVAILLIVAAAFALQGVLLDAFPAFQQAYLPVIVVAYLLGAAARLASDLVPRAPRMPERELNLLLFGPTMALVLTYAVMAIPLENVLRVPPAFFVTGALAIAASVGAALLASRAFVRVLGAHEGVTAATVFLGITTGWGPMAMSYLRRISIEEGPAKPIPIILPLNAFFLFPWLVILLTRLLFAVAG